MKPVNDSTYHTASAAVQQIEENLKSGRRHYRTKDGKLLEELDQVLLAITEDNLMLEQVGILYDFDPPLSVDQAIDLAVTQFLLADHCGQSHRTPEEARAHPTTLNGLQTTKHGLTIIADPTIRPGRVRVCTATPEEVGNVQYAA